MSGIAPPMDRDASTGPTSVLRYRIELKKSPEGVRQQIMVTEEVRLVLPYADYRGFAVCGSIQFQNLEPGIF